MSGGNPAFADDHRPAPRGGEYRRSGKTITAAKFFNTLERNGNSLGFARASAIKFIEKQQLPIFDGTQEYCLWLGCMGAYDPSGREIVLSLAQGDARTWEHHVRRAAKGACTGDPARRLGNDLLFSQLAEQESKT